MTVENQVPDAGGATKAAWALAGAMAILPFLADLPIDFDRVAPLVLLPAWWLVRLQPVDGRRTAAQSGEARLLTWLAVATGVSLLTSVQPAAALVATASWVILFSAVGTVQGVATDAKASRIILAGIALGAGIGCCAIWMGWREGTPQEVFPHYGHVRLFGLHMMAGTLSAIAWLVLSPARSTERWGAAAVAALTCGGMLWSGGRTPLVGVAVAIAVWWWPAGARERHALLRWVPAVFGSGLVLSLLQWSPEVYLGWWNAIERSTRAVSLDALSSTRLSFWQVAVREFREAPWFGHGPDYYRFITPKQDGSQPHNWLLQLLLDIGVIGAVPFIIVLARQFVRGWLIPRNCGDGALDARRPAAAILAGGLAAGFFDGVLYHAVALLPMALIAGIAGSAARSEPLRGEAGQGKKQAWAGPFVVAAAIVVLGLHSYVVGWLLLGRAPETPRAGTARLLRAFPSTTFAIERWLNAWRTSDPEAALEWCRWAQRHSDNRSQLHVYAAVLLSNRGDFAAAAREIDQAARTAHSRSLPKIIRLQSAIHAAAAARERDVGTAP